MYVCLDISIKRSVVFLANIFHRGLGISVSPSVDYVAAYEIIIFSWVFFPFVFQFSLLYTTIWVCVCMLKNLSYILDRLYTSLVDGGHLDYVTILCG